MDIIIKSFNRAYYLERCIRSIYEYITGDFTIHVLDDGTPPVYLNRVLQLFPDIRIHRSPFYQQKVDALEAHLLNKKTYDQFSIPSDFWREQIAKASPVFLLLEDDIWLTAAVSLDVVEETMRKNDMIMLRLSWQGNPKLISGEKKRVSNHFEEVTPSLSPFSAAIVLNKFRIASVLYRLKLLNDERSFELQLPFYTLYTVASAFFQKDYWLHLWEEAPGKVNEHHQLKQAIQWYRKRQGRFGKIVVEATRTSYITSTINHYKDVHLDMLRLNHLLNEAWLQGEFNAMENFPNDFSKEYIKTFLGRDEDRESTYAEWLKWIEKFKEQYRRLGCIVDY